MDWSFPGGVQVQMRHMQHEKNMYDWQGAQIAVIGFDELTHFTERQFWYLVGRNRSTCGVRPYVRATCNPDPDSFVASLISWYLDKDGYPILERSGVIRYLVRLNDALLWGDSEEELVRLHGVDPRHIKTFTFIPAKLSDNKILVETDPGYEANLRSLPEVERLRLLGDPVKGGNWKVRQTGKEFTSPQITHWPENFQPRAFLDPAYGGDDTTALAVGGVHGEQFIFRLYVWPDSVTNHYDEIAAILQHNNAGTLYYDQTADKGLGLPALEKVWPAVIGRTEKMNKHIKIKTFLQMNWSRVWFSSDTQPEALGQLLGYEEGCARDDVADALASLIREFPNANTKELIDRFAMFG